VRQIAPLVEVDAVEALASSLSLRGCVRVALAESRAVLGVPAGPVDEAVAGWAVPRREDRWTRRYRSPGRSFARSALEGVVALPGVRPRLAYAWALAMPDRAISDRHGGRIARWRLAARRLRGRRRVDGRPPRRL
jgi:hypothetical protein